MSNQLRKGTVCFIMNDDQVLLALIEYGPNDRKWNGIGGFANEGELLADAVVREAFEETDIVINKDDLKKVAELNISPTFQLNVFITRRWSGELKIKDETLRELKWFKIDELPYSQMHGGNDTWLPSVLNGKLISITDSIITEVAGFKE